jgi:hypothetical protein
MYFMAPNTRKTLHCKVVGPDPFTESFDQNAKRAAAVAYSLRCSVMAYQLLLGDSSRLLAQMLCHGVSTFISVGASEYF